MNRPTAQNLAWLGEKGLFAPEKSGFLLTVSLNLRGCKIARLQTWGVVLMSCMAIIVV